MLVAQCTGSEACAIPTGLPWYFAVMIGIIWLAVVVGAVSVGVRLLRSRRDRRRPPSDRPEIEPRSFGHGVEPW
jgi:hypothetical protein